VFKARAVVLLLAALQLAGASAALAQVPASMLDALGGASVEGRRRAADALLGAGPDAVDSMGRQLAIYRQSDGSAVFRSMSDLQARAAKGGDLVELLLQQEPDAAVTRAIATVCLMRALSRMGTLAAVRRLVLVAFDADGAFRPELFRLLKELDERALAALIEARGDASLDVREWAKDVLEAMGRRTPGDMVQTSNEKVLADILRAYGRVRDLDALPVVVSFVNSARAQVRLAAREATLAYGDSAAPKLRGAYAALTGQRLPNDDAPHDATPDATPDAETANGRSDVTRVAEALFDAYDHERLRDVYARLDAGLSKERAGDLAGAIADFDDVLAREPLLDRRAEMVPGYVAFAEGLEHDDRQHAVEYLHKALRIDDGGPQSDHVRSELLCLEGEDLVSRGIVDTIHFEEALALDAQNSHARRVLDRIREQAAARRARHDRMAAGVVLTGVVLIAIGAISPLRSRFGSAAPRLRASRRRRR
jgi:hypothetical protein